MDANLPEFPLFADTECIIEVLGILGVDGTGKDIPVILTATDFLRCNARIDFLGGFLHILRILVRQSVLSQDSVHLHIVVTFPTQYVNDFTHHIL